ncbi:MAG: hypothetical protein JST19_07455 [Bacteroidetes bacterium]|nr:hypothetical protein [Bacteroidota bacterium]
MDYFITLIFLLLSSSANAISHNDYIWFGILVLMSIYALVKKQFKVKDLKVFGLFSLVYLLYVGIRYFIVVNFFGVNIDLEFLQSDVLFLFKYGLLTFVYCIILREKLIDNVIKVMLHLTIIDLVIYLFQVAGFADVIYSFSESLGLPKANTIPGFTNFIIFSFTKGLHEYRNSGFVWEPGAYGCFLTITLLFHFFRNKFRFATIAIIFIVAIITTFSTTNYLALFIVFFLAYRYRVPKVNLWVVLMIPAFIILFMTIPVLGQKIQAVYDDDMDGLKHFKEISMYHKKHSEQIPLNRFASMTYLEDNLGYNLILGLSNKYDAVITKQYNVNISNGIFDFLAKFGVIGLLFLVFGYVKLCANFLKRKEYLVYAVLVLLAISFGEPILFLPLFLVFIFLPFLTVDFGKLEKKRPLGDKKPVRAIA